MAARTTLQPGVYSTTSTVPATQTVSVSAPQTTMNGSTLLPASWNTSNWCLPFIIYVILAIIGFILMLSNLFSASNNMTTGQKWTYLILSLIWLIFFGWLIWYLCKKGQQGWAWFVLFLPLIILALFYLFIAGAIGAFWAGYEANKNITPPPTSE